MPRIGDTVRPELQRADTSGILKGAAIGAEAMGKGIAAMGAGIAGGIKQRKENEKVVTGTISRMEALQKAQDPDSPLAAMLGQGIAELSNQDLSPRKAAAMAAGFNQSITDTFKSIESGIAQKAMKMQEDQVKLAASHRKGAAMGLADLVNAGADRGKLAEYSIASMRELQEDPDATSAYKTSAMQGLLSIEAAKAKGGSITRVFQDFPGADGKTYTHQYLQQNGKPVSPVSIVPKARVGTLGPVEKLTYEERSARQTSSLKGHEARLTAQPKLEQSTAGLAKALNIIGTNTVYSGVGGNQVKFLNEIGAALGFDKAKLKAKNAQVLLVEYGKEVMGQIQLTKGAVSEKEMAYFSKISPSLDKLPEANAEILRNKLKYADRELKIGRMVRQMRVDPDVTTAEIEAAINQYYIDNRVLTDEYIDAALKTEGFEIEPIKPKRQLTEDDSDTLRALQEAAKGGGVPVQPQAQPPVQPQPGPGAAAPVQPAPAAPVAAAPAPRPGPVGAEIAATSPAAPAAPAQPAGPVPKNFMVLTTPRDHAASRINLKDVKHVISTDFNSGEKGKPAPSPGIEAVVPRNAPAASVAKVKQYLKETETWLRSKGVKTSIRTTGKNKDGILYTGGSPRFYYTEPFFKTDAASRKAIEKDPAGYARILARTLGSLPGVAFIPPHQVKGKGAVIPGTKISEQEWSLEHVIPALYRITRGK